MDQGAGREVQRLEIEIPAVVRREDGSVGPAVAGASRELIEAKVLRGEYPPGYTPKRPGGAGP